METQFCIAWALQCRSDTDMAVGRHDALGEPRPSEALQGYHLDHMAPAEDFRLEQTLPLPTAS
jgi:hypothetical protein